MPYDTVRLQTKKGLQIDGWLTKKDSAKGIVILFHGISVTKAALLDEANEFYYEGYNILMLYDAVLAQNFASKLLEEGIYVIGFFFPVVPKGQARIRVQLSAAHEQQHLDKAIDAFTRIGKELGVLKEKPVFQ